MSVRRLTSALLLSAAAAAPASAQGFVVDRGTSKPTAPFKGVVAKVLQSTVRVRCDDQDAALGTVVHGDGLVVTKASELKGTVTCRLSDGTEYDAKLLDIHKETDLALLKVDTTGLKAATFADSKKTPVGNWLAAVGPTSEPAAIGIVSVATRRLTGFDAEFKLNNNRGFLGVQIDTADDAAGALVTLVDPTGAAYKAGLKKDDVIYEVSGKTVTGREKLQEFMEKYRPGDTVTVRVKRGGEVLSLKVTLTGMIGPKSRGDIQNSMGGELSGRRTGFPSVVQSDMVLDPKNCGGPIVDLDGNVIGIGIARAGRVESWVLPSEVIKPLVADMRAGKFPPLTVTK